MEETIRIDSTYNTTGLTFYFNHETITSEYCYNPFSYSFLGKKIFSDNYGLYHFINSDNDTLHIKSQAIFNESWIFYSNEDKNLRIWATVDSISIESFSGVTDSIKIIRFTTKDLTGVNKEHTINLKELKLSKHYGFSKIFKFDQCPDFISEYILMGIAPEKKGYLNFGDKEI